MGSGDKLTNKFKTYQWRSVIASLLIFLSLIRGIQYFSGKTQNEYDISYSKFVEQLDAGNIKEVTIRKLAVSGIFVKEAEFSMPPDGRGVTVRNFRTFLPAFQGEGLISRLEEKKVAITVESDEERSVFWQFIWD